MALPRAAELDLPIANPPVSGPAVDALEARKEDNNNDRFTEDRMARNFAVVKDSVIASIKRLSGTT